MGPLTIIILAGESWRLLLFQSTLRFVVYHGLGMSDAVMFVKEKPDFFHKKNRKNVCERKPTFLSHHLINRLRDRSLVLTERVVNYFPVGRTYGFAVHERHAAFARGVHNREVERSGPVGVNVS